MSKSDNDGNGLSFTPPTSSGQSGKKGSKGAPRLTSTSSYNRRPWQIGAAVAVIAVFGAAGAAIYSGTVHQTTALAFSQPLQAGTVITSSDLRTVSVPTDAHFAILGSSSKNLIVGKQLSTAAFANEPVNAGMIAQTPQLISGDVVVGVTLTSNQIPSFPLIPGDVVQATGVTTGGQAAVPAPSPTPGVPLDVNATVYSYSSASSSGATSNSSNSQYQAVVSLEVPASDALAVQNYASANQISLALVSEPAP